MPKRQQNFLMTLIFVFLTLGAALKAQDVCVFAIEENYPGILEQVSGLYAIPATDDDFKTRLFRDAMKLGIPRSELNQWGNRVGKDDVILEVATAIGVDDVYKQWLEGADYNECQYIKGTVAKYAAIYGRNALAIELIGELDDSPEKWEVLCRLSFSLGYEGNDMQMQILLNNFAKTGKLLGVHEQKQTEGLKELEDEKSKLFEQFTPAQWRECFLLAYHSGLAASGRPISESLNSDISTVLFRDTVRAFRAHHLIRARKTEKTLEQIQGMESARLKMNILHLVINETSSCQGEQSVDVKGLGKELFQTYLTPVSERYYCKSEVFKLFEEFDFGTIEPIEEIPFVASEFVLDVFEPAHDERDTSNVFASCISSGFCKDGLDKIALIESNEQRASWLKSVLTRFERQNELNAAWTVRKNFSSVLGGGAAGDEAYLVRLVTLACRNGNFELAETFVNQSEDQDRKQDARFTLAAHRQNSEDLELINTLHPEISSNFKKDLAAIDPNEQLEWLYKLGLRLLDENQLLILRDQIKREFALRKESKSKEKVARMVRSAARSMTPLGEIRQSFMEELAEILGIHLGPRKATAQGIEKVLKKLQKLKREDTKLTKEEKTLFFALCKESRETTDAKGDQTLARVAVAYAELGEKEEVTKLINLIEIQDERFFALLNCAMAYPPSSAPIFRGRTYMDFKRDGGFLPGGIF